MKEGFYLDLAATILLRRCRLSVGSRWQLQAFSLRMSVSSVRPVGLLELLGTLVDAAAALVALNSFLTLVIGFCGWLNFVKDAQRPHHASQAEASPQVDVGEVSQFSGVRAARSFKVQNSCTEGGSKMTTPLLPHARHCHCHMHSNSTVPLCGGCRVLSLDSTLSQDGIGWNVSARMCFRVKGGARHDVPGFWPCMVCNIKKCWPVRQSCFRCGSARGTGHRSQLVVREKARVPVNNGNPTTRHPKPRIRRPPPRKELGREKRLATLKGKIMMCQQQLDKLRTQCDHTVKLFLELEQKFIYEERDTHECSPEYNEILRSQKLTPIPSEKC